MDDEHHSGPEAVDDGSAPPPDSAADPERRKFLIRSISAIGAGVTAAVGVPAVIFVTGPALDRGEENTWIRLGSVSAVEPGGPPTLMKAVVTRRSGYRVEEQEVSVFVTTDDGQEFQVLSNVCSHLGCRVRWVEEQDGFFCPCHNAVFGPGGEVVSGPPPRALDQYEAMVEEGQILFKYREV